jgi:hypothetical protein
MFQFRDCEVYTRAPGVPGRSFCRHRKRLLRPPPIWCCQRSTRKSKGFGFSTTKNLIGSKLETVDEPRAVVRATFCNQNRTGPRSRRAGCEPQHSAGRDPVEGYDCFPRRPKTLHNVLKDSISLLDRFRICCEYTVLRAVIQTHKCHVTGITSKLIPIGKQMAVKTFLVKQPPCP